MVADGERNTMPKGTQTWKLNENSPLGPTRLEIHGNLPAGAPNMLSPYSCQRRQRMGSENASRPLFGSRRAQHETLDDAAIVRIAEPPVEPL